MDGIWIGAHVVYEGQEWEVADIAGTVLGLRDTATGERLAASLSRVLEENPSEDRLGRGGAQLNVAETVGLRAATAGQRQRDLLKDINLRLSDIQEVVFGKADGATDFKPGYGERSSMWSRAGLKAHELGDLAEAMKARDPELAKRLALSQATLFRHAKEYLKNGTAGLLDGRRTRNHSVTDLVPAEVLEACVTVNREMVHRSTVSKAQRIAMVKARIAKHYPHADFKVPGHGRLGKVLDELSEGQYLDGDAVNRRSAANVPNRVFRSRPALLPGSEMQVDSTMLDILLIFPDGSVRRPDCCILMDKATRTLAGFSVSDRIKGSDLAFMIAQSMTPRPRFDLPGDSKLEQELKERDLPWAKMFDPRARARFDARVPLIRPRMIDTDHGRNYASLVVDAACQQFGITLLRSAIRTPTDKAIVERMFGTIKEEFLSKLPGFTGGSVSSRGEHPEREDLLTLSEFAWLFDRWITGIWQNTPHEGLRDARIGGGQKLSPNAEYEAMFPYVGFIPAALSRNDYISLLPVETRTIQADGIELEYRMYDSPSLGRLRRRTSGTALSGKWEVHYLPTDPSVVWVYDPETKDYIECEWKEDRLGKPFAKATRALAQKIVFEGGLDPAFCMEETTMSYIDQALAQLRRMRKKQATRDLEQAIYESQHGLRPDLATIRGAEGYESSEEAQGSFGSRTDDDEGDGGDIEGFEPVNGGY